MQVVDLMKYSKKILETLSEYDIRMDDCKFIELVNKYDKMVRDGHKVTYIIAVLASEYNISESSVYRVIKRMKSTINT